MAFFSKKRPDPAWHAPSEQFPAPLDAILHALRQDRDAHDGGWCTFDASSGDANATIQVSGNGVNTLLTPVELPRLLDSLGLAALASQAHMGGKKRGDPTLWMLPDASPDELAVVVDALFTGPLALGSTYSVVARREC